MLINFPLLKRGEGGLLEGGGLFERGEGLIEDLRYIILMTKIIKIIIIINSQSLKIVHIVQHAVR